MYKVLVISNYNNAISSRPEAEIFIHLATKYGIEVSVMTFAGSYYSGKFKENGIRVIDFHPVKKFDKSEIKFIRDELVKGKYDFVHLFNSKSIINGLRAAKGINTKVIIYRGYTGNIHWYDPTAFIKVLHPRVDKIWCNSLSVKEQIDRQLFFNRSKTVVITKGHSPAWYSDVVKADLALFDVKEDDFTVVSSANDRKMKGLKYLISAIELLDKEIKLKLLILGGDTDFVKKYSKRVKKNKDKIIFTGFRTDNLNIVKSCRVYISSSIKGESFQKSVAEAMHLGVCPVITDIPGNKGMVIDRENGLIIKKGNSLAIKNALLFLYNNQDTCKNFGNNARYYISYNFSIDTTVKKVLKLYEELTT